MSALFILCLAYSVSLFYRGMISVIAPELAIDLALDDSSLGLLSSTFFISFAVAQVPAGLALDRYGARLTVGLFLWFSVLGSVLFCSADSELQAFVGQALIGVGCAPVFTGSMLFIGRQFSPDKFAYITALVIALGSVGDLFGTTPLALLVQSWGWRLALVVPMILTALVACLCLQSLPADRPKKAQQPLSFMLAGMVRVIQVRQLWPVIPMFLASYAVLMAIRGLWSGPYLADVFALDGGERGMIILAMSLAMAVGTFFLGLLDRRLGCTKMVALISSLVTLIPLVFLALRPAQGPYFAMWAFVVVGLFGFNYPLLMSHCRSFLAPDYHGRGMALLTALSFIGVALVQSTSGWVIEAAASAGLDAPGQYRMLFVLLTSALALASLVYSFSPTHGNEDQPSR
ncbi:MAG: MFS transporter [Motiliproteus sp.]